MDIKEKIAKIFKEARKKQGLTQKQLGKKADVDKNYYSRIERAGIKGPMPRVDVVDKVARALGVTIKLPMD